MTLLIPAFALPRAPPVLALRLLRPRNAPLPYPLCSLSGLPRQEQDIHSFGTMLEPRYVVGARALDQ
jgi:hypothetical protein